METITIKDVARICGVGVSTVSRAINNHPDINQETKDKIMQVIKDNNYIPNNSARNLKRSDSRTIAVLIKGISNPFFNKIIKVFEEEAQKKRYSFILHRVEEKEDEIDVALQLEKEKKLRGIVFLGGYFSHSEEKLQQLQVPFVLCTIGTLEDIDPAIYSSVSVDDFRESYRMADYLCKLGHKKIAIIAALPDDESIGKQRYLGYRKALEDNGITFDEHLVFYMREDIETYSMENGYEVTKAALASGSEFTALYVISDSMAIGACKAILESGKRIPEDYSVAGFDGIELARYYHPSLTTMKQPGAEMAAEAIHLLFDLIKKRKINQHKIFAAELMEGQSTRAI